jgi:hypothetical protein
LNDAFLLELEQRKPNVTAVGVEAVAKILLYETLARVAPAEYDVLFQAGRNNVGQGFFARGLFAYAMLGPHLRSLRQCRPPDAHGEPQIRFGDCCQRSGKRGRITPIR